MTTETATDASAAFASAARRGGDYLIRQLADDGSYRDTTDDIVYYYKAPWALLVTGHPVEANRVLDFVKRRFMREDGDFSLPDGTKSANPFLNSEFRTYSNVWIVMGAHKLGRFDISYPGVRYLLTLQDEATGGFRSGRPGIDAFPRLDALTTSFNGQVCLYLGRIEEATRAGRFLVELIEQQPEGDRFFPTRDLDGNLVVEPPSEEQALHRVLDATAERQWYFHVGHAGGFLHELFSITGDDTFRQAAERYISFAERCRADVYAYPPSGKLAWGAATSFRVTGGESYRSTAERIGRYLMSIQNEDGSWRYDGLFDSMDQQPRDVTLDLTQEFTSWLAECAKDLSSRG